MKKVGVRKCKVYNKISKLVVIFALVGAMMIVVPMFAAADARSQGQIRTSYLRHECTFNKECEFTNVKYHLDSGKWVIAPRLVSHNQIIEFVTEGSGFFGGVEKGTISANMGPYRTVIFSFNNPVVGKNTCGVSFDKSGSKVYFPHPPCLAATSKNGLDTISKFCYEVSPISEFSGTPFNPNFQAWCESPHFHIR